MKTFDEIRREVMEMPEADCRQQLADALARLHRGDEWSELWQRFEELERRTDKAISNINADVAKQAGFSGIPF